MRIHPKHPTAAFWQAALFATALIALWLLLTMLLPEPVHQAPDSRTASEITLPQRAAACSGKSDAGTGFAPAPTIPLPVPLLPSRGQLKT